MGTHGGGSEGFYWIWGEAGAQREDPRRNHQSRYSASANQGGLIDFALAWLGYASCAMFPEIGICMSGSRRAGCPRSV